MPDLGKIQVILVSRQTNLRVWNMRAIQRLKEEAKSFRCVFAWVKWRRRWRLKWKVEGYIRHPSEVVYVDPSRIKWVLALKAQGEIDARNSRVDGKRIVGAIVDDRYLIQERLFADDPHVKALVERYCLGKEWNDTGYSGLYDSWYRKLHDGKHRRHSWDRFECTMLKAWDRLYQDMKQNGYRSQDDPRDEVQVAIDGRGEVLFCDGRHRLYCAQLLQLPKIPVIVNVWSKDLLARFEDNVTPGEVVEALSAGSGVRQVEEQVSSGLKE